MVYNEDSFLEDIQKLPKLHQIAFAASCCERLLPVYQAFQKSEQWGNFEMLRACLDTIWESIKQGNAENERFESMMAECEKVIPDSEDFGGIYIIGAQNAPICIIHTLEYCQNNDIEDLRRIKRASDETVFVYLDYVNDPSVGVHAVWSKFIEWIPTTPLYQQELRKQKQDISELEKRSVLDSDFLDELRNSNTNIGISPFKRGLIK